MMPRLYHWQAASLLAFAPAVAAAQSSETKPDYYELDLHFTGRDGRPVDPAHISATLFKGDAQTDEDIEIAADGTAKIELRRGTYTITSYENVPLGDEDDGVIATMLVYPELELEGNTTIEMDERVAKPVEIEPPLADAELYYLAVDWDIHHYSRGLSIDHKGQLFTGRLGPDAPLKDIRTVFSATWLPPGAPPDSPYQFHYAKFLENELVTGYQEQTRFADYFCTNNKFARGGASVPVTFVGMGMLADPTGGQSQSAANLPVALPSTRRMFYYNDPQLEWNLSLTQFDDDSAYGAMFDEVLPVTDAGRCREAQWNQGVFGPGAGTGIFASTPLQRVGNSLTLWPSLVVDSEGRARGGMPFEEQHLRVLRGGELLKEVAETQLYVDVPSEAARYRIEVEAKQQSQAELSTNISLAWELESEARAEATFLPVSYIRFLPELSQNTAAPRGETFELPIRIEPHGTAPTRPFESLTVEVSYDDGGSWSEVPVSGDGTEWIAELEHPQQSGYASLRAAGQDADDNTTEVTIIRAYRLE